MLIFIWNHNIKLTYYPFAIITCLYSSYFGNPFFLLNDAILLLINNDFCFSLPPAVRKPIWLPKIIFYILKNWSFKQKLNKISLLVILALYLLESTSLWVVIIARVRLLTLGSSQTLHKRDYIGSCCYWRWYLYSPL